MNKRRSIQDRHEQCIINEFIRWWASRKGESFQVVARPNPPEAVIQSEYRTTWLEVTDAYFSDEWAKDLYSLATPEEEHTPMDSGPYVGMDQETAERFVGLLKQKLSKQSYSKVHAKYGRGMLLVVMQSPWFNNETCEMLQEACQRADWLTDLGYFSHVFISYRAMNRQEFEEWKWDV